MTSKLFSPLQIGPLTVPNRIAVAPMCQYSALDGAMTDWHLQHLMTMAMSGAGLIVVEATGVERNGRITHGCTGLYNYENERAMQRVLQAAKSVAPPGTKFAVQIGHAGRKASAQRPWEGGGALKAGEYPWQTLAPSALANGEGWHTPAALDEAGLARLRQDFVQAANRAVRIGFDAVEIHMAHGYLLHTFCSPLSNQRSDAWGGTPEKRRAYPLSIAAAVRKSVPKEIGLGARITGSDWIEGGLTPDDAAALASDLKSAGLDYVCVSSGGITGARIALGPGYQVPFAAVVKARSGMVTRTAGLIAGARQAEEIIASGQADQVALARALLDNPRWPWHAAEKLGAEIALPKPYERAQAKFWPGAKLVRG